MFPSTRCVSLFSSPSLFLSLGPSYARFEGHISGIPRQSSSRSCSDHHGLTLTLRLAPRLDFDDTDDCSLETESTLPECPQIPRLSPVFDLPSLPLSPFSATTSLFASLFRLISSLRSLRPPLPLPPLRSLLYLFSPKPYHLPLLLRLTLSRLSLSL